jgi:hypothetical protein
VTRSTVVIIAERKVGGRCALLNNTGYPWAIRLTDSMKRNTKVARVIEADAGLERLKHLAGRLASAPSHGRQHRTLSTAIRVEADAYRKSLDTEQATATHDANPLAGVGPGSLNRTSASRKPTLVPRRRIRSSSSSRRSRRSAPRR